jgi:hypothetical protein
MRNQVATMIRSTVAFGVLAALLAPIAGQAQTLDINYYTIGENDQDANHLAGGVFSNEVQQTLGADGLPLLNTTTYGCTSNCYGIAGAPTDVTSTGEITYWSPALNKGGAGGTSDVVATGSAIVTLPFNVPQNFFPPNGTGPSDYDGFQAATLTGTLVAPTTEQISFNIGSDDMAFAYLDGQLVCSDGGVHPSSAGACVTPGDISAGSHSLELFFVDINNSQSGLTFGINTEGVTTAPPPTTSAPEIDPAAAGSGLALMVGGLLVLRGRTRRAVAAA